MILPNRVKVERNQVVGTSPTGAVKTRLVTIIDSLKCDLQPDNGVVVVPQAGQTAIYYKDMLCNVVDIRPNDIVTDLDTQEKFKVINTNVYSLLSHMEVRLQGGVI